MTLFSSIENQKVHKFIVTPINYAEIIASTIQKGFPVIIVKWEDFFDVKALAQHTTNRSASKGALFATCQLVMTASFPKGYIIKNDYAFSGIPSNTIRVFLQKQKGPWSKDEFDLSKVRLQPKYQHDRLLMEEKIWDL